MASKYGSEQRLDRNFGDNVLVGNSGDSFFKESSEVQDEKLAWSEGCPVPQMVAERGGYEGAVKRYGEIIMARQLIWEEAKKRNPKLFQALTTDVPRHANEPVGQHEPEGVPQVHIEKIVANNTPWGYSLPRVLVVRFGPREKRTQENVLEGLQALEETISKSDSPLEFLAIFSERLVESGADVDQTLRNVLSAGYLRENNTHVAYQELFTEMQEHSPRLMERYGQLSSRDKQKLGIAEL